jgi:hypothetical protein
MLSNNDAPSLIRWFKERGETGRDIAYALENQSINRPRWGMHKILKHLAKGDLSEWAKKNPAKFSKINLNNHELDCKKPETITLPPVNQIDPTFNPA